MYGCARNGAKMVASMSMPAAIGPNHHTKDTGTPKVIGTIQIMATDGTRADGMMAEGMAAAMDVENTKAVDMAMGTKAVDTAMGMKAVDMKTTDVIRQKKYCRIIMQKRERPRALSFVLCSSSMGLRI
jgi:hypothetical protein